MVIIICASGCALHDVADGPDDDDRRERAENQALRARDDRPRDIDAKHVKGAVRDVDRSHHAEDQREPAGDQEQQRGGE